MSVENENNTENPEAGTEEVTAPKINQEVAGKPLEGLVVQDGIIMLQLVDRLFQRGAVAGREALPVGILRQKLSESLAKQGVQEQ